MSTLAASSLGTRLRAERECRGLTLEQVSASTKIPAALLEALERDDLSRWPKGFYRRAFFRAYVTALGLRPEPLAGEFARLFLDEPFSERPATAVAMASPSSHASDEPPRPMSAGPSGRRVLRSLVVALVEVAIVLAGGALLGWATGMTLLTASGAVALVYYPFIRAGAGRVRQSRKTTLRTESTVGDGVRPTPPQAQQAAVRPVRLGAARRVRSGLAIARTALGHLHSHVAQKWLPRTKGMIEAASQGSRRAGPRAWHVMRRAASATYRMSARGVTRASVVLWRACTVASDVGHKSLLLAKRMIEAANQRSRSAATRSWHAMRHAAMATYRMSSCVIVWAGIVLWGAGIVARHVARKSLLQAKGMIEAANQGTRSAATSAWHLMRQAAAATHRMSSRVVTWASIFLRRAAIVASDVARKWLVLAKRSIEAANHGARWAAPRAWRMMRSAAATTYRLCSRVVMWASVVLWRAGIATTRALGRAARQTGRGALRGLLWANQAFWQTVRITAGHAEQLAARQLNRPASERDGRVRIARQPLPFPFPTADADRFREDESPLDVSRQRVDGGLEWDEHVIGPTSL